MERLTKKLIKNFITILGLIVIVCSIGSSIIISKSYLNKEYNELKYTAEALYHSIDDNDDKPYRYPFGLAVIVKDNTVIPIGSNGMMKKRGMALQRIDYSKLKEYGELQLTPNENLLFYNLKTEFGNIVVFKNRQDTTSHIKLIFTISLVIFVFGMIVCIPLISYIGKKMTRPIIQLQKVSSNIANGNFNNQMDIKTNDEIEDLSKSINHMAKELGKKYALQRDFVANVSHDFKTPLSVIRNYSEAIGDGILDRTEIIDYSKDIIEEVDKLDSLVKDLLALSKLQGKSINLKKEEIGLKQFLEECKTRLSYLANEKNIIIEAYSPEINIMGDRRELSRVLYNFIHNAIKFSPNNSIIKVGAIEMTNSKDLKVYVKDYGTGIEKEKLDEIWNRYYKHSQSGGMGLGLAISSEILKLHDFRYGVKSELGNGSEFFFIVPNTYR